MKKAVCVALGVMALVASPALAKPKIVVSLGKTKNDTFLTILKNSLIDAAAQHPDLDIVVEDADNNSQIQNQQIRDAIAQKVAAIVVMGVDVDSTKYAADATAKAGVPLVFVNRLPPMDRFDGKVAIVACNDLVAGRLQMRLVAEKIKDSGNVVILRGEDGHPAARDRTAGVKEIIDSKPGLHLVKEATGNWSRDQGEQLVTQWLGEGVHIDAIAANNDEMALGAVAALQKAGYKPGQVAVGGVDGTVFALDAIKSGYLTMSVLQNAKAQAQQALNDAAKFANKDYAQLYDWVPYEVIIPANVDKYAAK